jgi:hypothetical protein
MQQAENLENGRAGTYPWVDPSLDVLNLGEGGVRSRRFLQGRPHARYIISLLFENRQARLTLRELKGANE